MREIIYKRYNRDMEINLGKILPIYRGTYDPDITYTNLDIVSHKGNVYISIIPDHHGYTPDQWDTSGRF